jgi:hypothetical protein
MDNFDLRKYLAEGRLLKEEQMGSYRKFLKVVKSYEDEEILSDFLDSYPKGQDISKSEYDKFTEKHLGLADPEDHRGENWKYIMSEGKLFEEVNPIWVIDAFEDSADIEQAGPAYKNAVIDIIKSKHPDISDKDLEASIEVMNVTWYNEARSNAKGSEPEEMKVSAEDFADGAIEHYEDIIVFDNNNLAEGKLLKENKIKELYRFRQYLAEGATEKEQHLKMPFANNLPQGPKRIEWYGKHLTKMMTPNTPENSLEELLLALLDNPEDFPDNWGAGQVGELDYIRSVADDIVTFANDYMDLAEGRLFEEKMSLEVDDDYIELSADSGEYDGDLNDDGTVDFSVVYDDGTEFDESNWKSILGKKHAFVKISNQIPTKVEAAGDYVMITVDLEDLKNLIKPNKSKNMKNLGSYETKDSKGNIVKRYI